MDYREVEYSGSTWYNRVISQIINLELTADKKFASRYQLEFSRHIARRLDEFSTSCVECERMKHEFSTLINEMDTCIQTGTKEGLKQYRSLLKDIQGHLTKIHKLVKKGYYIGIGLSLGPAFMAIGMAEENKAIKEDRIV